VENGLSTLLTRDGRVVAGGLASRLLIMKRGIQFLALIALLPSSCNRPPTQQTEVNAPPMQVKVAPATQFNGSAAMACSDFRITLSEVSQGSVKNTELQRRVASVYERARLASLDSVSPKPPDDFEPSAEEMLRATIEGNTKSFGSAVERFSNACKAQSF